MSVANEPSAVAVESKGPQTHDEAHWYHQGFIGGLTVYARERGESCLKSENELLRRLMDEQGFATVELYEKLQAERPTEAHERMLVWFEYAHLPSRLQEISRPFGVLAGSLCLAVKSGPERTVALRKLLEAKDAAVRAALNPGK